MALLSAKTRSSTRLTVSSCLKREPQDGLLGTVSFEAVFILFWRLFLFVRSQEVLEEMEQATLE